MKNFCSFLCALMLLFFCNSRIWAQDVVSVQVDHDPNYACSFNFTFSNHNSSQKNIDGVTFNIISPTNSSITFDQLRPPIHWTQQQDNGTGLQVIVTSDNGGITAGNSLGGFLLDYIDNATETPVTIQWIAQNSGTEIDEGTVNLVCTGYQSFNSIDTVGKVITSQSGPDPCFAFTFINRNLDGNQNFETKYLAFQLLRPTDGTLRPSKISPAIGWVLDSVTTYTAYFHTDGSPLNTNNTASPFTICLRGNQNSTAFSFVWSAYNELGIFYDRDTVRDVPNTVTGAPTDADSVSATAQPNSCLYTATVKDYHVSNTLPASRIVRFTLVSKTTGITFSAAPNAPASWTSRISSAGDSVIYTADSTMAGIPGGIVNSDFSFVVSGPTTTPFNIGWETDQGSPLTQKFTTLTTGTLNLSCTPAVPATDSVTVSLTTNCTYKVTLKNAHNIKTPSNLVELTLSIPSGSGQITGLLSTANWNISNVSPTLVKFDGDQANSMTTGDAQDLTFSFAPQTPGSPVNLTWATFDAAAVSANAPLYTGTVPITCTPSVTICDTLTYDATTFGDTLCVNKLTLHNRKLTDIMSMVITPTNGWKIDTASTPNGWTKQIDGSQASVTYLNANGFKGGEQDEFDMRFFAYHDASAPNPDVFAIVAVTTDRVGATCQSVDTINGCLSHINPKGSVQMHSEDVGISNFAIRPNPTQGQADISFDINTQERVVITVLDILGHQMATLNSKMLSEGSYTIPYTMSGLPDGTYYVRVQTPLGIVTKKLILTK